MKTQPLFSTSILSLAMAAALFQQSAAQTAKPDRPNAAGTWKWNVTTPDGQSFDASVILKQDAEKLTGTYKGRSGEAPVEEGKISGNTVSFKVTRKRDDQTFVLKYEGKLDGDQIKGTAVVVEADNISFDWNAKREPAKANMDGTWKWSMARPNGEKLEATMKLKLDGEKLTGTISGGDWTVELENGRVTGEEIAFQTSLERDGQKLVAKSKAKLSGNKIKGTAEFTTDGESRVREWEAERQ